METSFSGQEFLVSTKKVSSVIVIFAVNLKQCAVTQNLRQKSIKILLNNDQKKGAPKIYEKTS